MLFHFTSDGSIQKQGFLLTYEVVPPPACNDTSYIDLRDMSTRMVQGWLSQDRDRLIASGIATEGRPPQGHPSSWLTGYGAASYCNMVVLTPPGARLYLELHFADLGSNDTVSRAWT